MQFNDTQPIYQQIAEWICRQIIEGTWGEDERIPSVRDLGSQLEVNPNTCMRSYEWLQEREVIYNKRGIGYFVSPKAPSIIREEQRKEFFELGLPQLYKTMRLLDIDVSEIVRGYEQFISQEK